MSKNEVQAAGARLIELKRATLDVRMEDMAPKKETRKLSLEVRRNLKGHTEKVMSVCWYPDNEHLLTVSFDGQMVKWDANLEKKEMFSMLRGSYPMVCAVSPTSNLVACGGLDNKCTVFEARDGEVEFAAASSLGTEKLVSGLKFVSGSHILVAAADGTVALWDYNTKLPDRVCYLDAEISGLAVLGTPSEACPFVVSATPNRQSKFAPQVPSRIALFDPRTGEASPVNSLFETADVTAIASVNQNVVLFGNEKGEVKLWDVRTGASLNDFAQTDTKDPVTCVESSRSGKYLFAGYASGECRVLGVFKGELLCDMPHSAHVTCLKATPDGSGICSADWSGSVQVWA